MTREREESLPPFIATSDPGSFAMRTIVERKPRIIAQVIEENDLGRGERDALEALLREMRMETVSDPFAGPLIAADALLPEERSTWEGEVSRYVGRRWLDIPWYFAEAFFYLRLLAACGYFAAADLIHAAGPVASPLDASGPGADTRARRDPFRPLKQKELTGPHGGLDTARQLLAARVGTVRDESLRLLLFASLWGNRVDLSNFEIDEKSRRFVLARDTLVVDHTERALAAMGSARRVHIVLDNAGPELVSDLLLAAALMESGTIVTFHAKRMPFFVSDAMPPDVLGTIDALESDGDVGIAAAGKGLRSAFDGGQLHVRDHWFWSSPLHFTCMTADLRSELEGADLVVVKGDANYRRLLEDRKWEPWRSMDELAGPFPRPFLCLRTMKSEIVVDVPRAMAARLRAEDPEWLFNGKRGIVRYCERNTAVLR